MDLSKFKINNKFLMLALDHRGSFKKLINHDNPEAVTIEVAIALKKEIINSIRVQFSSLLIDAEIGLPAFENPDKPFLLPVEKSGYEVTGEDRVTEIAYSISDLKQNGAAGAKLLIYFNPNGKSAEKQLEVSKTVLAECQTNNFPLFLEIRTYLGDREADKMNIEEREEMVLGSIKAFLAAGIKPEVYKLEYPGTALGCQKITAILGEIPWIMLTMGASFEEFKGQLQEATIRGCQGFLAGRALWQEVCTLQGEEKAEFLSKTLPERFKEIASI